MSVSASSGSGSTPTGPSADDLIKNLIDSVTPTSSAPSPVATTAAPRATTATPRATAVTPAAATAAATTAPPGEQSTSSTPGAKSASSHGGATTGLSVGLAVGAVLVVAAVVLLFRQRKRRRYSAPHGDNDLGTPQLSIELPRPPHFDASTASSHMKRPSEQQRPSVFTSVQNGGESLFTAAGEVSPGYYSNNNAAMRAAPSQYRVSNDPQTGPTSTTFRMDSSSSSVVFHPPAMIQPAPDSGKTASHPRTMSGRAPPAFDPSGSHTGGPASTEGVNGSLPRDTITSTASVNSLHDSTCGDLYTHGDGLGDSLQALQRRKKNPSMVLEEDEGSNRSRAASTAAAQATPKAFAATPATPAAPMAQPRRPPPPPPPAAAFVKPPVIATSNSQTYRPSTESEIAFQRLSSVSSDSLGSVKRASSTLSVDSANPRAGSIIEITEVVGKGGVEGAKEIEI